MKKEDYINKYGLEAWEKKLEQTKKWKEEHKERNKDLTRKWYIDHPERGREITRNSQRHTIRMFAYVIPEEKELIENYELALKDDFKGWTIHHKRGTDEISPLTRDELKALNMYYDRPASELIFLTRSEHMKLHQKFRKQLTK